MNTDLELVPTPRSDVEFAHFPCSGCSGEARAASAHRFAQGLERELIRASGDRDDYAAQLNQLETLSLEHNQGQEVLVSELKSRVASLEAQLQTERAKVQEYRIALQQLSNFSEIQGGTLVPTPQSRMAKKALDGTLFKDEDQDSVS